MEVRCRHCCKSLFKGDSVLFNAHHEVKQDAANMKCQLNEFDCCSYMTLENVPDWIMNAIDQKSWIKGKLYCPYCNSRLGSFNFVNEMKCCCNEYVKPPIRIVNSKVDILCESLKQ
ncbi:E3 ubiquitin-protein ligase RNF180-like [Pogonomyrmex barbatus]|uniref:E3 ubiquitin-protein ligase RNF180-like n=1 Tax=Pogonomyrmex barbatus TaxID=144034 RepID=A0A6I9W6W1_9HYME|nr:E3 ubiquitin-protein ligase RNF180-like [Pogonomyrmex barbatus]XP_011637783.1 E3 ubiquitin-protein ligase RNF180-like [Pogonomyrmex barbatus]